MTDPIGGPVPGSTPSRSRPAKPRQTGVRTAKTDDAAVTLATSDLKRERGSDAEWAMVKLTAASLALTFATAVAAIGAALLSWSQLKEMQSGEARAEAQVRAAQTLADAAVVTATARPQGNPEGSEAQGEVEGADAERMRARLVMNPPLLSKVMPYRAPAAHFKVTNIGPTSARNVKGKVEIALAPHPSPVDVMKLLTTDDSVPTNLPSGMMIGMNTKLTLTLTPEYLKLVRKDPYTRIYTYGMVTYDDIYGRTHHSYVCALWGPDNGGTFVSETCPTPLAD